MGRPPRNYRSNSIYHLTTHGVDDRPIFLDDVDRQGFAIRLARVARDHSWQIFAACLLDTHHHLVVQPTLGRVGEGMKVLNGAHSRAFNRRHERRGALFESRYEDREIQDDEHPANAIDYVEFNAVSAGMVKAVEDWPWSTHRKCPMRNILVAHLAPEVSDAPGT